MEINTRNAPLSSKIAPIMTAPIMTLKNRFRKGNHLQSLALQHPGPSVTPEHRFRPNYSRAPASSHPDINAEICKDVGAYMDWLVQKNPQDAQALEEAKEVFINDGCDVEILKTM